MGKKQGLRAAAGKFSGQRDGFIGGDGENGSIQHCFSSDSSHAFLQAASGRVQNQLRAKQLREFPARLQQVSRDHVNPPQGEESRENQSDGSLTNDEHGVASQERHTIDRFEDRVYGLQHSAFHITVFIGNSNNAGKNKRHDTDVFGITAARRLEAGGNPGALVGCALRISAVATDVTFQTGNVMMQAHTIPDVETANPCADPGDESRSLMSENPGRRNGAVLDFLDIRRANAADGHFHQDFIGPDGGHRDDFDPQIVYPPIDQGVHFFGNQHGEKLHNRERDESGEIKIAQPLRFSGTSCFGRERGRDAESVRGVDAASTAELNDALGINAACLALASGSGVNPALRCGVTESLA